MNAKRSVALALALFSLVAILGFTPPASARVGVSIGIGVGLPVYFGPPPLRREVVYARPGPDYTWVGGYWDWRPAYHDYCWVGGRWVLPAFRDSFWVAPRYERFGRGFYYHRGFWDRGFNRVGFRGHEVFRGRDFHRDFRGHDGFRDHRGDHGRGGHDGHHRRY
ncbi:MAG TPA: hypothetical protein VF173_24620 [Thermoanaerobaculia bacterium]|nr:hypothetical protein [Thermoanaerobaculia bacterium]